VGAPIYKQEITGKFINTILAIRNKLEREMTFKELLLQVRATFLEATENQNYPIETLLYKLDIESTEEDFPLFDVAVLLKNIHDKEYIQHIRLNTIFSFMRTGDSVEGELTYNSSLFTGTSVNGIIRHFDNLMQAALFNLETELGSLEILSGDEKRRILYDFNHTKVDHPLDRTIHDLFEEQVLRQPGATALLFAGGQLTYGELNKRAARLAGLLIRKGVRAESIVAVMVERSFEMIIGMLGILKADGAYLPIDCQHPPERINYMFHDSGVKLLLTQAHLPDRLNNTVEHIVLTDENIDADEIDGKSPNSTGAAHLAYVIYTSGSTGRAKGVGVAHRSIVNTLLWRKNYYHFDHRDAVLQILGYIFDSSVEDIFTTLISGARLTLIPQESVYDLQYLKRLINEIGITYFLIVPGFYKSFLVEIAESLKNLRAVTVAGDSITEKLVERHFKLLPQVKLYNEYGPTENSVCSTAYEFAPDRTRVLIGKPIDNVTCYILNPGNQVNPIGVPGELCVAGKGLARGYIKRPDLTREKFVENPFEPGQEMYRSGDLARWLEDGNIDFLGRIDYQVKIRGFRIELGEIETQLLNRQDIKEAVVVARGGSTEEDAFYEEGDKYLCAYIVADQQVDIPAVREGLAGNLPEYMIPAYFVQLAEIPLTPNGKVDRKALPKPDFRSGAGEYTAPRDKIEKRMMEIWSEVLKIGDDRFGIDSSFFDLGGHSLIATILVSRINKEFNVKVPMVRVFESPTIRGLAEFVKAAEKEIFASIPAVEKKDYYVLSSAQNRLFFLRHMELEQTAYNVIEVVELEGELEEERLAGAFRKLIDRHESLRTSFDLIDEIPVQRITEPGEVEFAIEHYDLSDRDGEERVEEILKKFIRVFDLSRPPLIRAGLIKKEPRRHVLMVDMHHIATDGVSHGILVEDFVSLYRGDELPYLRLQYKDYAEWQQSPAVAEIFKQQEAYWLKQFEGDVPVLNLPADYSRPAIQSFAGKEIFFGLTNEETKALNEMARSEGGTLFMVILALFNVFLAKVGSQEDIVVGTPIAGRRHADLERIIGMFINTLALRNYPTGEKTFKQFLGELKERTLESFENQDYLYEDLVDKAPLERDMSRNPMFDVLFELINVPAVSLEITPEEMRGLTLRPHPHENKTSKFDLILDAVERDGRLNFSFNYCIKLFRDETVHRLIRYFKNVITAVSENPEIRISAIEIVSGEEKFQLLYTFNDFRADYPGDRVIHSLFAQQVDRSPDTIALFFEDRQLSYRKLDETANRLGGLLRRKGVRENTIAGIMVERSLEMVAGIFGILKSGGAYLPLNPQTPQDRARFMFDNASVNVLLTQDRFVEAYEQLYDVINLNAPALYLASGENGEKRKGLGNINSPTDVAYVIYTSGSTGKPKGVMIENRSVINIIKWFARKYDLKIGFNLLQMFEYTFDASVNQIFGSLLHGATLHVIRKEYFFDIEFLYDYINRHSIHLINFVQSVIKELLCGREELKSLKYVISGAEKLRKTVKDEILDMGYALYNQYGPTEATVDALAEKCSLEHDGTIGVPVANAQCYVIDKYNKLNPVGVAGELVVGGDGLARGYVNNVELTAEKFVTNPFGLGGKIYKTGDLTRWFSDGVMEFLGRIDQQIKIRGFRIEPGEIESQLLKIPGIKETKVVDREHSAGDKYLCAYLVLEHAVTDEEIRGVLTRTLPDYMIPSYFVELDDIPLTVHGKLDRKALPEPEVTAGEGYAAPRNRIECSLVEVWSEILKIDKEIIGIDSDFFELGGHSLRATIMVSKVHKKLNVRLPLKEVFKSSTIRELSQSIAALTEERFTAVRPSERKAYYVLSSAQKRLYILQQINRDTTAYNMPMVLRLEIDFDRQRFEETFAKLIARHENLRTSFEMIDEEPVQRVHESVDFKIDYYDLDASADEARLIAGLVRPFNLSQPPLLRVKIIRPVDGGDILMVDTHHIISDGISHGILRKDFMALYGGEQLPGLKLQYKDYAQWQEAQLKGEGLEKQEAFWLKEFQGEIPVLELPTDYPRPPALSFAGDVLTIELSKEESGNLEKVARQEGATMFMVLLALTTILFSKLSGQEDIVIGTPVAGRRHADLEKIIGVFINTLALRNFPQGEKTIKAFLAEVRERTLNAFENQEYQFETLVERVVVDRDPSRSPLFDTLFAFQNYDDTDTDTGTKDQPGVAQFNTSDYGYQDRTTKFDLDVDVKWVRDRLIFSLKYSTDLFKRQTIERFVAYFREIVSAVIEDREKTLSEIAVSHGFADLEPTAPDGQEDFGF
jgi:amino acid adenylation domain-containing protein